MTTTPSLNVQPVLANQNGKETTINNGQLALEQATQSILAVDLSSGNVTLNAAQFTRNITFDCSGQTANRNLVVPLIVNGSAAAPRFFCVRNNSATYTVVVKGATGATVTVQPASAAIIQSDGTDMFLITTSSIPGGQPYDIGLYIPGVPTDAMLAVEYVFVRSVTWPVSLTGSKGVANVAATGTSNFDLLKNGSSIGTASFAGAATTATFTFASAVTFAVGDKLKITCPATADLTLADIAFTFLGTR